MVFSLPMLRTLLVVILLASAPASAAPWALLPDTNIEVLVPWRGLTVRMVFPKYGGRIDFDERHPEAAKARIDVWAGSVQTGLPPADRMAKSEQFLAADRYPIIRFDLDRLVQTSKSTADIHGRITLRGVTQPILFKARVYRYAPSETDPDRFEAGFLLDGTIDRTAFGATGAPGDIPAVLPVEIRLDMISK